MTNGNGTANKPLPRMGGLLLDLDGTLYHGSRPIEQADLLIRRLKEWGLPYRYVTNNSTATPEEVAEKLRRMGIEADAGDVCTSAQAAAAYIAEQKPGAVVHIVGETGLRQAAKEAGLIVDDEAEAPDFVLQGIDRKLTYETLAAAVRRIRGGAAYVMTNPDLLLPTENGLTPGAGSIGAMLKAAGGKEPILIGKPSPILMDYALDKLAMAAEETWVVGDNLATDIAAGHASGCGTALVLTGLTTADNFEHYAEAAGCKPDVVLENLNELISYISRSIGR
ncbi:TIGR01457 family HAD-type hydrolase [Paenibacillus sp. NPDC058071]|uniref:TIGR01457 family HAD-type hydrolase n=1 Tax=Paenibacillus sp. NPDC058071 TaxID=3346326 RepID=UPI0036DDB43C